MLRYLVLAPHKHGAVQPVGSGQGASDAETANSIPPSELQMEMPSPALLHGYGHVAGIICYTLLHAWHQMNMQ